jgi:hypothetical protein
MWIFCMAIALPIDTAAKRVFDTSFSAAPTGLVHFPLTPRAYALGFILAQLRGFSEAAPCRIAVAV